MDLVAEHIFNTTGAFDGHGFAYSKEVVKDALAKMTEVYSKDVVVGTAYAQIVAGYGKEVEDWLKDIEPATDQSLSKLPKRPNAPKRVQHHVDPDRRVVLKDLHAAVLKVHGSLINFNDEYLGGHGRRQAHAAARVERAKAINKNKRRHEKASRLIR